MLKGNWIHKINDASLLSNSFYANNRHCTVIDDRKTFFAVFTFGKSLAEISFGYFFITLISLEILSSFLPGRERI